jgi:hypothetical protein
MRPVDYWDSSFDECILTYKGKVDEWRFFRNGFNLIHCSMVEKPADILKVLPLPFDDEIETTGNSDDLIEQYNLLKESGALDG